jgi:hypothetical protein
VSDNKLVDDSTYHDSYTVDGALEDPMSMYVTDLGTPTADDKGWAAGVPFWEACVDAQTAIDEKDSLLEALGTGAVGLELLGMAIDPIGTVVGSVAGWLMEHIRPIRECLDLLAGNPDLIQDVGTSWGNISGHLGEAHKSFVAGVQAGTSEWRGAAGDAYRATAGGVAKLLHNASEAADVLGRLTLAAGEVVAGVRQFVRDLIAEVVSLIVSRGASMTGAAKDIAKMYKIAYTTLDKMGNVLTSISIAYDAIKGIMETSVKAWRAYREGAEEEGGD